VAVASAAVADMQICTSPQTDNHTSTPPLSFLPFLLLNQQRQSTEGNCTEGNVCVYFYYNRFGYLYFVFLSLLF